MKRLAIICTLALGLAISGVAQSQGRAPRSSLTEGMKKGVARLTGEGNMPSLKKALAYVGLSLMLCFGSLSCNKARHLPETERLQENANVPLVDTTVKEDRTWYSATVPTSFILGYPDNTLLGVFRDKTSDIVLHRYHPVKLYDEIGRIRHEALQVGWIVLYEEEGSYFNGAIDSISKDSLHIVYPDVIIDASQVRGVHILGSPHFEKEVIFSAEHALPYEDTLALDVEAGNIYYRGKIFSQFTDGSFAVLVQSQRRRLAPSSQLVEGEYHFSDSFFTLVKAENLIVIED